MDDFFNSVFNSITNSFTKTGAGKRYVTARTTSTGESGSRTYMIPFDQTPDIFTLPSDWFPLPSNIDAKLYVGSTTKSGVPEIRDVIFNPPATIVLWGDGSKTVVKCQNGDTYSKETGLALAICKKVYGNTGAFNDVFNKWVR